MERIDSLSVVFDRNRRTGNAFLGRDADPTGRMTNGILEQIPEHFRQIGPVERHAQIVRDARFECDTRSVGCSRERRDQGARQRRELGPGF